VKVVLLIFLRLFKWLISLQRRTELKYSRTLHSFKMKSTRPHGSKELRDRWNQFIFLLNQTILKQTTKNSFPEIFRINSFIYFITNLQTKQQKKLSWSARKNMRGLLPCSW
jgi:hypothetical protein